MIEGVTLAFAVGLFAVVCPSAVGFAIALAGLPVTRPIRTAAVMGACFAAVFASAALLVSGLDLDWLLDVAVWIAAAAGVVLAAWGIRVAFTGARRDSEVSPAACGAVFAIAALPSMLTVFDSIVDQGVEAAGAGAAVVVTIAFGAGSAAALTLPALAAAALGEAGATRPVVRRAAGALGGAAGVWIVLYWLPALFGGRTERGGAVESAANDVSSAITELAARYEIVLALVLLAISVAALLAAARPRRAGA